MKAKIFIVLEFRSKNDEEIENRVHYVAATSSQEAEEAFKEDFGRVGQGLGEPHYYILTDEAMQRSEDNNCSTRCQLYADSRHAPAMSVAAYTSWILSYTRDLPDYDSSEMHYATYRRIN